MRACSLFLCLLGGSLFAAPVQPSTDSTNRAKRLRWATVVQGIGYGGTLVALDKAWYSQYPRRPLHSFNDWGEWKQMDKLGHVYGTYIQGKTSMELWRWAGAGRNTRIWAGGLTGTVFQTLIEYMDGRSTDWGWSWGDVGANLLGSAWLIGQELAWDEQRVHLKFSFHPTRYQDPALQQRSLELFGKDGATRMLKDYNAQTYWASIRLKAFWKESRLPPWLCLSIGTGASGLWGGRENLATVGNNNVLFDRRDIPRKRQWYLAPDIDFTRIPTKKKWVRVVLFTLNAFKCPTPTIEWQSGKVKLHPLFF